MWMSEKSTLVWTEVCTICPHQFLECSVSRSIVILADRTPARSIRSAVTAIAELLVFSVTRVCTMVTATPETKSWLRHCYHDRNIYLLPQVPRWLSNTFLDLTSFIIFCQLDMHCQAVFQVCFVSTTGSGQVGSLVKNPDPVWFHLCVCMRPHKYGRSTDRVRCMHAHSRCFWPVGYGPIGTHCSCHNDVWPNISTNF